MSLIQCLLGPTETVVGGDTYTFAFDEHRRAVASVNNLVHQACFLSVEHYILAPEVIAEQPAPEPANDPADDNATDDQDTDTDTDIDADADQEAEQPALGDASEQAPAAAARRGVKRK